VYRKRVTAAAQRARAAEKAAAEKAEKAAPRSEWWTPDDLRARVLAEHDFGLDAAACALSTLVPGAWLGPTHPDPERRDALGFNDWAGLVPDGQSVWLNPPYAPVRTITAFLATAARTAKAGVPVVALVPAATSTAWWWDEVQGHPTEVEFLRGRVRFTGPHSTGGTPLWGSALVTYLP